jgi:GDP-D-mannose dehydratase
VNRESIARFISESDYSARAREAQKRSADKISEKAELVLLNLEKGCDNAEIAKARELAHHYRWLAAKKNPTKFGDSTKIQSQLGWTPTRSFQDILHEMIETDR